MLIQPTPDQQACTCICYMPLTNATSCPVKIVSHTGRHHTTPCSCMQAGFLIPLSIADGDACYDDKADIAELNGLQETTDFALHPDKPPTNELMAFLRLVNVSGK